MSHVEPEPFYCRPFGYTRLPSCSRVHLTFFFYLLGPRATFLPLYAMCYTLGTNGFMSNILWSTLPLKALARLDTAVQPMFAVFILWFTCSVVSFLIFILRRQSNMNTETQNRTSPGTPVGHSRNREQWMVASRPYNVRGGRGGSLHGQVHMRTVSFDALALEGRWMTLIERERD